jgi:serine/threonine-protein kinase
MSERLQNAPAELRPGTRAGGFEVLRPIGRGGQATVYLARPWQARQNWLPGSAPLAALKVAGPAYAAAIHDEHGWLAGPGGEHPHLARLYRRGGQQSIGYLATPGGEQRRAAFIALEYEPGRSLEQILAFRRGQPLPTQLALAVAAQAASALHHLHHRLGIVHHDVKPANLLIRQDAGPRATLIDLGAAESPAAPRRRWRYGTSGYLPPESLAGAAADPQVDIYGLGQVLRAMLCGGPDRPIPADPDLAALIDAATAADPQQRRRALPDMAALLARLNALRASQPMQETPP